MQAISESLDSLPLWFEAGEEVVALIGLLIAHPAGNKHSTGRNSKDSIFATMIREKIIKYNEDFGASTSKRYDKRLTGKHSGICIKGLIRQRAMALCLMLMASVSFSIGAEDDHQLLINRISADFQRNPDVSSLMNRYDSIDGRFRDIDYTSTSQTAWQPREHLMCINVFVYAFTHGGN